MKDVVLNKFGFFEIRNKPSPEDLKTFYAEKYYQNGHGKYQAQYTEKETKNILSGYKRIEFVISSLGLDKGSLLDIGCGEGWSLEYFSRHNWKVKGIDYSEEGIKNINPDLARYLVIGNIFEELGGEISKSNKYDLCILNNVLEHVLNPEELLCNTRQILKPNGILVVTVPNDFSDIQSFAMENGLIDDRFWIAPPAYLSYFSRQGLTNLAEHCGMQVKKTISDFPIDLYLLHSGSNYVSDSSQGKPAHKARILFEEMMGKKPVADVVALYEQMANVGIGRHITMFLQKARTS